MTVEFLQTHAWWILAAGLCLMLVPLLIKQFRTGKRATPRAAPAAPKLTPQEQAERQRQARGMRGDLEELMVEIERMTRRVGAQLDTKAGELEKLLQEAHQKIDQLNRLTRSVAGGEDIDVHRPGPALVAAGGPPAAAEDPVSRNVYELADRGHDSEQIARKLNEHVGKVELILALREA